MSCLISPEQYFIVQDCYCIRINLGTRKKNILEVMKTIYVKLFLFSTSVGAPEGNKSLEASREI